MSIAVCEKPAYPISKHLSINEIDEVTEMNFGRRCMGSQCAATPFVPVRTCESPSSAPEEWGVVTSKMIVQHRSFKEQAPEFFGIQDHQLPETVAGISGSRRLQSFRGCYPGTPPTPARHVDVQRRHVASTGLGLCDRRRNDRQQTERFLDDPSNSVCQG